MSAALLAVLGATALLVRDVSWTAAGVTAAVGLAGLVAPAPSARAVNTARWLLVTFVGTAAFGMARLLGSPVGIRLTALSMVATVVLAVAEEAFFRRYVYGLLARFGEVVAVAVTAVAFGLVHVPVYGWRALPIDVAAGLVLGWQRAVSRTWTSPAVAHAVANLLMVG